MASTSIYLLRHLLRRLDRIERLLIQIGRAVITEGEIVTDFHAELDADLAALAQQIADDDADLARELADFSAAVAPRLSDDERAQLAGLAQRLADFRTQIDQVDPAPAAETAPAQTA